MKILFVTDDYLPKINGIVRHIEMIKQELEKRGHTIIIIAPRYLKKPKDQQNNPTNGQIIEIPAISFFLRPYDRLLIPFNRKIEKYILDKKIDIIHNHGFLVGFLGLRIGKKGHIPKVITLHTFFHEYLRNISAPIAAFIDPLTHLITRLYFSKHNAIIANSPKGITTLKKVGITQPITMIHNGIDLKKIATVKADLFLKSFKLKKDDPLIVLVGRIDRGKNIDIAIEAFTHVLKTIPNAKLAIVGDGILKRQIEKLIDQYQLTSKAFITGMVNDEMVISANKAATVALFTSDTDTFPTVVIEALACGKSVVAIHDEAYEATIQNNENGLLTSKNPEALAQALIKIIKDQKLRHQFQQKSLELAKLFSIEAYVDQLEALYQDLSKKRAI